ncbi:DUF1622 domain-containing protein [Mesorhizobium sp. STM 4661]|uniref:DUF1622 domain-containing protein n=1 Tax=Mesorhizobium sp. STM 4661 TaxID=1297570 RepID=UPI0002BE71DD|nr:DUF1622 domain-containing protein [Mesorhizobium sp. STM 4661]CCV14380.1 conserved hypothetical protein [Mesorhizobium sp. STM 4661]
MEAGFAEVTAYALLLIDAIALCAIVYGTIEAFIATIRALLMPSSREPGRGIWLRYARWLVAGLTFQLAADIIETMVRPGWDDIGRLAAIAVIRTFLSYFLDRDISEAREETMAREMKS